jgi:Arc/MetJ-type ribon-helix-helix transcriptional regulator
MADDEPWDKAFGAFPDFPEPGTPMKRSIEVDLPEDLDAFVQEAVRSGRYPDADAVIEAALVQAMRRDGIELAELKRAWMAEPGFREGYEALIAAEEKPDVRHTDASELNEQPAGEDGWTYAPEGREYVQRPVTPSKEALEMARQCQIGFDVAVAAVLQKLMDERDQKAAELNRVKVELGCQRTLVDQLELRELACDEAVACERQRAKAAEKTSDDLKERLKNMTRFYVERAEAAEKELSNYKALYAAASRARVDANDGLSRMTERARRALLWARRWKALARRYREHWQGCIGAEGVINDQRMRAEAAEAELREQMEWATSTYGEMRARAEAAERSREAPPLRAEGFKTIRDPEGWRDYAMLPVAGTRPCPDCGNLPGEFHDGCDQEICPKCQGQALSCDCVYREDVSPRLGVTEYGFYAECPKCCTVTHFFRGQFSNPVRCPWPDCDEEFDVDEG